LLLLGGLTPTSAEKTANWEKEKGKKEENDDDDHGMRERKKAP